MSQDLDGYAEGLPTLELVFMSNGIEVARSKNSSVWISAMAALSGANVAPSGRAQAAAPSEPTSQIPIDDNSPLQKFAADIGLNATLLEAAADPTVDAPFIHLDHKYWEAFKNSAGFGRTAPVVLAAALLLLWGRHTEVGEVTTKLCSKVLAPISLTTKNAARGIDNCDWLQFRGTFIKLNPSLISKAEELIRAYCNARG